MKSNIFFGLAVFAMIIFSLLFFSENSFGSGCLKDSNECCIGMGNDCCIGTTSQCGTVTCAGDCCVSDEGSSCGSSGSTCASTGNGVKITHYSGTTSCSGSCVPQSSTSYHYNTCSGSKSVTTYSCNSAGDDYVKSTKTCGSNEVCVNAKCVRKCGSFGTQMTSAQSKCRQMSGQSSWFSGDCSTGNNDANKLPVNQRESAYYYGSGTNINLYCVDNGYCKPAGFLSCWFCSCFTCQNSLNYDNTATTVADCTDDGKYDSQCVAVKQCGSSPVQGSTIETSGNMIGCDFVAKGTKCTTSSGAAGACDGSGKCVKSCASEPESCSASNSCCNGLVCVNTNGPITATNTGNGHCCKPPKQSNEVAFWDSTALNSNKCRIKAINPCPSQCTVDWCIKNVLLCSKCNSNWISIIP